MSTDKKLALFPKEYIDNLPSILPFSNPSVVYLLKSKNPVIIKLCSQLENWFTNIPVKHKNDLLSRLRSKKDRQHIPAFYELMWHQFFLEENYKPHIHSEIEGTKKCPDFLVKALDGKSFYFEVATIFENIQREKDESNFNHLTNTLSTIEHYFLVFVIQKDSLPLSYNKIKDGQRIKKFLIQNLDTLNPLIDGREKAHVINYNENGISLTFDVLGKKDSTIKSTAVVGAMPRGYFGDATKQIKSSLRSKVKKYKALKKGGKPLVIAICSNGNPMVDEYTLESAIIGYPKLSFALNTPGSERWSRDMSGLLTPDPSFKNPENTRLSAVIFCNRRLAEKRVEYTMNLYHNPWSINPLPGNIFTKIPQLLVTRDAGKIHERWSKDRDKHSVAFD